MKKKKNALAKNLKDKLDSSEISEELAAEIAASWMEIADTDESGSVDIDELRELVQKLEIKVDDSEIKSCYTDADGNEMAELLTEEFGQALFKLLKSSKDDNADNEEAQNSD